MNNDHDEKTPRDWLLDRHISVAAQIDALRRASLPAATPSPVGILREIFRPHRTAWRVLATAWLLLLVFRLTVGRPIPGPALPQPSPDAVAAWFAQLKSHETFAQTDRHR
jgi:hypothetical protein